MATPARPDIRRSLRLPTDLARSSDRRVVAGVCGGLGHSLGVDANVLRLAVAVLTIPNGSGPPLYLVAWLLLGEPRPTTVPRVGDDDGAEEPPDPSAARAVRVALLPVGPLLLFCQPDVLPPASIVWVSCLPALCYTLVDWTCDV